VCDVQSVTVYLMELVWGGGFRIYLILSELGLLEGPFKHGNRTSGSKKWRKFLDCLIHCYLLMESFAIMDAA